MSKTKRPGSNRTLAFSIKSNDSTIRWDYFPAGKNGGQKGNKTASACRVTHLPSGATGESREQRSQWQNRKTAWARMVESTKFKIWLNQKLASGPTPEERVESDMASKNLRVEVFRDGKWVEIDA